MDEIIIEKIRLKGRHGCFAREREEYRDFEVSLRLGLDLSAAAKSDELSDTVDYPSAMELVEKVIAGESVRLIEKLADKIAEKLFSQFRNLEKVQVEVSKLNVDVGYEFEKISVKIDREKSFYL